MVYFVNVWFAHGEDLKAILLSNAKTATPTACYGSLIAGAHYKRITIPLNTRFLDVIQALLSVHRVLIVPNGK